MTFVSVFAMREFCNEHFHKFLPLEFYLSFSGKRRGKHGTVKMVKYYVTLRKSTGQRKIVVPSAYYGVNGVKCRRVSILFLNLTMQAKSRLRATQLNLRIPASRRQ